MDISNVEDFFTHVFQCDIKIVEVGISPLKNWNVSKWINFRKMFVKCYSIQDKLIYLINN